MLYRRLFLMFVVSLLAACGGGGGDAPPAFVVPAAVITSQPASQSAIAGQPVTFSVGLQDASGASYQWMRNGIDIAGAVGASYTLPVAQVADSGSTWSVRARTPGGTVTSNAATLTVKVAVTQAPLGVSLLAGRLGSPNGNTDGAGQAAHFYTAAGIAIDAASNVYVADANNATVRKISPVGVVTTLAGAAQAQGTADGTGSEARFDFPDALTLHSDGFLYVMDRGRVRRVSLDGVVTTVTAPVLATPASPGFASTIASGKDGLLYVSRGYAIYRFAPGGTAVLVAGALDAAGNQDGAGANARFGTIYGIAVDAQSVLYVGDGSNSMVRTVSPNGEVTTLAGARGAWGFADGTGSAANFRNPSWPAFDPAGNLWVSDGIVLRRITPAGVVTTPYGDQPVNPIGGALAFDAAGNLFANYSNGVAKVDKAGVARDFAGDTIVKADLGQPMFGALAVDAQGVVYSLATGTRYLPSGETQSLPEALRAYLGFSSTRWVTLAPDGNFIVTDSGFSSGGINQVSSSGGSISRVTPAGVRTVLGTWSGPTAYTPGAVAADGAGNIYFVDYYERFAVRKLAPDGTVTTLVVGAGGSGYSLYLGQPSIAVSPSGTLHIAYGDRIATVDAQGKLTVLAGVAGAPDIVDGAGAQARLMGASSPAFDAAGNLYVGDRNTVRKITPAGIVTTVAGQVKARGNTTGLLPASISAVGGLAVAPDGLIYLSSDWALLRIRQQ